MVIYGKTNVCIFRELYLLTIRSILKYIKCVIQGRRLYILYFNYRTILFRYEIDYSDESHSSTTILSTLAIIFLSLDEMDSFTFDL